jgi:hypothetical protein
MAKEITTAIGVMAGDPLPGRPTCIHAVESCRAGSPDPAALGQMAGSGDPAFVATTSQSWRCRVIVQRKGRDPGARPLDSLLVAAAAVG